jgi:hypothetical protein
MVLACATFASTQTVPAASSAAQPSPVKRAKIRELIELTDAAGLAVTSLKAQVSDLKRVIPLPPLAQDDFEREFLAAADVKEFVNLLVPIYERHFSDEDLDGLLAFYRSPIGGRLIKALPLVSAEARKAGEEWGEELGKKVGRKIGEKLAHGDYGPWPPEHQDLPQEKH